MVHAGIIAKYNLETWYTKTFTASEKAYINDVFPAFCLGAYEKDYSAALALATNIIPALDLPKTNYFEYRKTNAKVQEKIIKQVVKFLELDTPLIEKHIVYNIIIYYIMHHQGIFIDSERAIKFSEEQIKISSRLPELIAKEKDRYPEFDLERNYGYETLYKIYNRRNDKDKCLDLIMKVQAENWQIDFGADILSDIGLLNAYCKKTYKGIYEQNPRLFIQNVIHTLKYPKDLKHWIEIIFIPDELHSFKYIDMENPIQNLKAYKCYIGIILNSEEAIFEYLDKAKHLLPENEVLIHSRNPKEIIICIEEKDVGYKKKIESPYCDYCAKQAHFLNLSNFTIDLETLIANYMIYGFDFLKITDEFQDTFNTLINAIDKKNFTQEIVDVKTYFLKPKMFTEADIKKYIKENADKIINNSWHSLDGVFYGNDIYDLLPEDFDYNYDLKFVSKEKEFEDEHKIKSPFSGDFENQYQYLCLIPIKQSINTERYLKLAMVSFPNHVIKYEPEVEELSISIEKGDFILNEIDNSIINKMIENSHDIFLKAKETNDKTIYADDYIDLAACAEYIFACNSHLIAEYKLEYFEKLKNFLSNIDKNDFKIIDEIKTSVHQASIEIDYSLKNKIDFNTDKDFKNFFEIIKQKFITNYIDLINEYWQFLDLQLQEKEVSNIPFIVEYKTDEKSSLSLLYDMEDIAQVEDFIPKINKTTEREVVQKSIKEITFGINLSYISLDSIKNKIKSIFGDHNISLSIKKRIAVVKFPLSFADYEIITERAKLKKSFDKHLGFVKLAYITNMQCLSENQLEYISDESLLTTIVYNESRYLVGLKNELYEAIERFYYAIGRENFVEKYDDEDLFESKF